MTETVKVYRDGKMWEREVRRYVDIAASCCTIRVHGYEDETGWRWVNIDLASTHDVRASWKKRPAYAWSMLRYGTASREFIELVRSDEVDEFIAAVQKAREVAFGSPDTRQSVQNDAGSDQP